MDIVFMILITIASWLVLSHVIALWLNSVGVMVTSTEVAIAIFVLVLVLIVLV